MELVPWRPFGGELSSLRREMDNLWNRFFGKTPLARRVTEEWWPSVDMSETKDSFIVKAELPGLDAKDVDVSISGDVLTIKGEKKKTSIIIVLRDTTARSNAHSSFRAACKLIGLRRPSTRVS